MTFNNLKSVLFTRALFAFLSLAFIAPPSFAEDSFETRIPKAILDSNPKFLTLTVENDSLGSGTDQNYTSGFRLSYFDVSADLPDLLVQLVDALPAFEVNDTTSVYYSLGQNLFTPANISTATPDLDDRPYAAFLYGSAGLVSVQDNHIDNVELSLGVVGPMALGEDTQREVHSLINSADPKGWDHQLENEPAVILSAQRRWPEAYATDIGPLRLRAAPHVGGSLGNVYTYAAGGFGFHLMPKRYQWQSQPLRVRPATPGTGFFSVPDNQFAWSVFAGAEGRAVGRNIFLDGNSFRDSPSVDKRYFVADVNGGVSLTYGRTQLSYSLNWRSREFRGQDDASLFGALSLGHRF